MVSEVTQLPTPQPAITAQPPPLPRIDNIELYTIHDEPMPLQIRRTYIRIGQESTHIHHGVQCNIRNDKGKKV